MKKTYFILVLSICFFIQVEAAQKRVDRSIILKKHQSTSVHRSPEYNPPRFTAQITDDEIIITAQNHTGTVQVQITGAGGSVFHSFYMDGAAAETVSLTALTAGNYTISLITESGTYTGSFVL